MRGRNGGAVDVQDEKRSVGWDVGGPRERGGWARAGLERGIATWQTRERGERHPLSACGLFRIRECTLPSAFMRIADLQKGSDPIQPSNAI